jgi:hypothetical protein
MIILSSLSPSLKSASRLTRYVASVQERDFPPFAAALRLASSLPPSGDGEVVESSGGHNDAICSNDDGLSSTTVLFPWRHKLFPVSRLISGTPEQKKLGLLLTSKGQKVYGNSSLNAIVTAYMFLNVPWYELFWISHFQDELSSNISWSFTQGVAGLLSNLPSSGGGEHIPVDRIITERDGTCEIDFRETIEISRSIETDTYRVRVVNDDDDVSSSSHINNAIPLRRVFHEKAIELYQSSINEVAKTGNNNHSTDLPEEEKQCFEMRLKMIPYDFEFITLYAIPYLSRRNAKDDPDLLTFYSKMLTESSGGRAPYLSRLRQDHLENQGYMESTIIAQCLVWCDEIFYVKDLTTGQIVQGQQDEKDSSSTTPEMQKTPHLVRMERTVVTKRDPITGNFTNDQEDWIITDIDDLLGGNLLV